MISDSRSGGRELKTDLLSADLVVVGGGVAGVCCAITAAREGLQVVLVQDRPVLGGNASSEVRLWVLGATAHMGTNNRWCREGGVLDEMMLENLWRNPEGNALVFDTILLEKTLQEKNLVLLLNTACCEAAMEEERITSIGAYCSQNETFYRISAPLYCDASGDGVLGFLAGAAFRMGAEKAEEFGEKFAPTGDFGHLLGHSLYFYSKDTGRPVKFVAPAFALKDIENTIPRYKSFSTALQGCMLWWIEWGGRLDTVHETEHIKWELWKVVYGVWNYIKNSGNFPEAENLTLEWVGHIPGKRESRRFEGDYILTQPDIVERRLHEDAVAFGGWSIDLHPADGVYAKIAGSHHLYAKGIYQIPYRCYYSRNVENLFLAGRIISSSHVAFGSIRVMATCGVGGQAVGHAAAVCKKAGILPRQAGDKEHIDIIRRRMGYVGHHVPATDLQDPEDLVRGAAISATSSLQLRGLPRSGKTLSLDKCVAQMLPLSEGESPNLRVWIDADEDTTLLAEFRTTSDPRHHAPDLTLEKRLIHVKKGEEQEIALSFDERMPRDGYAFLCLTATAGTRVHLSDLRLTGLLRVDYRNTQDKREVGGECFETFRPERRPGGHNIAFQSDAPLHHFKPSHLVNGWQRPTNQPNAWIADPIDATPEIALTWPQPQKLSELILFFDGDFDHALETVQWGHPERAVVFCVKRYEILSGDGNVLAAADDNHQSRARHLWPEGIEISSLRIRILETWGAPPSLFEIRAYRTPSDTLL